MQEIVDGLARIRVIDEDHAQQLNPEQQRALDLVLEGKNVFVTGVGGTGKSVLLREMRRRLETETGKVVGITAPTGLAAEAIEGATIHHVAGFGLPKCVNWLGFANPLKRSVIKSYDVLMIDEVSMVDGEFLDRVSEHMSAVRQNSRPFGGMQIVLFGDFLQLGPIDNTKKRALSGAGFCPALILNRGFAFESWTWRDLNLQFVELTQMFRQSDQHFAEILRRIRWGIPEAADELLAIIQNAEGNASRRQSLKNDSALRLVAKNVEADRINDEELKRLKCKQAFKFKALDRVELSQDLSPEMATRARYQLEKQGVPPDARIRDLIELKKGAKVMMLKNMEIFDLVKLVNGSRGYVSKMVSAALVLPMLKERHKKWEEEYNKTRQELHRNDITDQEMDKVLKPLQFRNQKLIMQIAWIEAQRGDVRIPYVVFQIPDHEKGGTRPTRALPISAEEFKFETVGLGANVRVQIPLMHAWAITIHKAQGMTLDSVKVMADGMFADGQAYVAFSRARTPTGLAVEDLTRDKIMASSTCKEFYRVGPEKYEATRMWWENNPSPDPDPQAQILERLIQIKGRNEVKDALAFNALKQKLLQDEKWRCRSCSQCYLCCYQVKEDVDRTVRESTAGGRAREQDDTEDDRQRQRARVQGDEPAEDDGESEDDDEVPEAIMPTQLAPTTQPAAAVGE